ncbi:hypothetical protein DYH10_03665 [Candidatus Saccharibacteria bacterium CPR2]|nr:hypothetical protein [Candidatus Saccharibacteria bacterium CPR2]
MKKIVDISETNETIHDADVLSIEMKQDIFLEPEIVDKSLEFYRNLNTGAECDSPQFQGLSDDEFISSLQNPYVIKEVIGLSSEDEVVLPIFIPITYSLWHSPTFYREKSGNDEKNIFYYNVIPELTRVLSDARYKQHTMIINELAKDKAVLVFDFREDHELEGISIIEDTLENARVQYEHIKLGAENEDQNQAYQTHYLLSLNRTQQALPLKVEKASTMLNYDVYRLFIEGNSVFANLNASAEQIIEGQELIDLWEIYDRIFSTVSLTSPIRQGLSKEEFDEFMRDPSTTKIVRRSDGKIAALGFFVEHPSQCKWLNTEYYRNLLGDNALQHRFLYFPGILTNDNSRGLRYSQDIIDTVGAIYAVKGVNPYVAFECCDMNARFLPELISNSINATNLYNSGKSQKIAAQKYFAVHLKSK